MATLFAFGSVAYTYDRYGVQDNSMILANVEAMSSGDGGEESSSGKLYSYCSSNIDAITTEQYNNLSSVKKLLYGEKYVCGSDTKTWSDWIEYTATVVLTPGKNPFESSAVACTKMYANLTISGRTGYCVK